MVCLNGYVVDSADYSGGDEVWVRHEPCHAESPAFSSPVGLEEVVGWADDHDKECKAK